MKMLKALVEKAKEMGEKEVTVSVESLEVLIAEAGKGREKYVSLKGKYDGIKVSYTFHVSPLLSQEPRRVDLRADWHLRLYSSPLLFRREPLLATSRDSLSRRTTTRRRFLLVERSNRKSSVFELRCTVKPLDSR